MLKDPDTRKHYDLHGDTESGGGKRQYHSYTYYRDQFGIYDDDPLIVTLSRADYGNLLSLFFKVLRILVLFYRSKCS